MVHKENLGEGEREREREVLDVFEEKFVLMGF